MKGDPAWAFDVYFLQDWLSAFLLDLRELEATGFKSDDSCPAVEQYLREIAKILDSVPNVRPPAQSTGEEFRELVDRYLRWNNKVGDKPEMREERILAHGTLKNKKDRLATRARKNVSGVEDRITWTTVQQLFEKLSSMVNDKKLAGVFDLLGKNLASFPRITDKYRGAN